MKVQIKSFLETGKRMLYIKATPGTRRKKKSSASEAFCSTWSSAPGSPVGKSVTGQDP